MMSEEGRQGDRATGPSALGAQQVHLRYVRAEEDRPRVNAFLKQTVEAGEIMSTFLLKKAQAHEKYLKECTAISLQARKDLRKVREVQDAQLSDYCPLMRSCDAILSGVEMECHSFDEYVSDALSTAEAVKESLAVKKTLISLLIDHRLEIDALVSKSAQELVKLRKANDGAMHALSVAQKNKYRAEQKQADAQAARTDKTGQRGANQAGIREEEALEFKRKAHNEYLLGVTATNIIRDKAASQDVVEILDAMEDTHTRVVNDITQLFGRISSLNNTLYQSLSSQNDSVLQSLQASSTGSELSVWRQSFVAHPVQAPPEVKFEAPVALSQDVQEEVVGHAEEWTVPRILFRLKEVPEAAAPSRTPVNPKREVPHEDGADEPTGTETGSTLLTKKLNSAPELSEEGDRAPQPVGDDREEAQLVSAEEMHAQREEVPDVGAPVEALNSKPMKVRDEDDKFVERRSHEIMKEVSELATTIGRDTRKLHGAEKVYQQYRLTPSFGNPDTVLPELYTLKQSVRINQSRVQACHGKLALLEGIEPENILPGGLRRGRLLRRSKKKLQPRPISIRTSRLITAHRSPADLAGPFGDEDNGAEKATLDTIHSDNEDEESDGGDFSDFDDEDDDDGALGNATGAGLQRAVAMFQFAGESDDHLSFEPGDVITLTQDAAVGDGWMQGRIQERSGQFPSSYVRTFTGSTRALARTLYEHAPSSATADKQGEDGMLWFGPDELVRIIHWNVTDGWSEGECNGARGIFPSSYVDTFFVTKSPADA